MQLIFWLALKILVLQCLSSVLAEDCSIGDTKNTHENCVHIENQASKWEEAENFCKARHGHLASVHNAFDMNSLRGIAGSCQNFWLGGKCDGGKNCQWNDGTAFDYNAFRNGNAGSDDCIVADTKSGVWTTKRCDSTSCVACEISGRKMRNCQDWQNAGFNDNGKYTIILNDKETEVYCDMETYGGGWIVFQNRVDGSTRFWDRTWEEFKNGFGDDLTESSNFWLGNEPLHILTSSGSNVTLRVELHGDRTPNSKTSSTFWWSHYFRFTIGPEASNYPIDLYMEWPDFVGNASSAWYDLTYSAGAQFSTIDRINDPRKECVTQFQMGGWWLKNCALSSLNGAYVPKDWNNGYGLFWIVDGGDTVIHPYRTRMLLRNTI